MSFLINPYIFGSGRTPRSMELVLPNVARFVQESSGTEIDRLTKYGTRVTFNERFYPEDDPASEPFYGNLYSDVEIVDASGEGLYWYVNFTGDLSNFHPNYIVIGVDPGLFEAIYYGIIVDIEMGVTFSETGVASVTHSSAFGRFSDGYVVFTGLSVTQEDLYTFRISGIPPGSPSGDVVIDVEPFFDSIDQFGNPERGFYRFHHLPNSMSPNSQLVFGWSRSDVRVNGGVVVH